MNLNPTLIAYSQICPRKAWLSYHGLWMEQESEAVALGRLLDQGSFKRAQKDVSLHAEVLKGIWLSGKVDWVNLKEGSLHETKKGRSCEDAHIWQLKTYLWLLRVCEVAGPGGEPYRGKLHYPELKQTMEVELEPADEEQLRQMTADLALLVREPMPPPRIEKPAFCKKCAFEELCFG